jgi:hypothetical protein
MFRSVQSDRRGAERRHAGQRAELGINRDHAGIIELRG